MKIEVGKYYRTRNNHKARVYAVDGGYGERIHGAILRSDGNWMSLWWTADGKCLTDNLLDLVSKWTEPHDFDPSCLPAWAEWIAMDESGEWFWFQKEPTITVSIDEEWVWMPIEAGMKGGIHHEYAPRGYTGQWNDSLYKVSELKNQES